MWRFHELLPIKDYANIVSLGELWTPLIAMNNLQKKIGGGEIIVKDEGRLPTGSFKTRGLAMAITMAKEFGIKKNCNANKWKCRCCFISLCDACRN